MLCSSFNWPSVGDQSKKLQFGDSVCWLYLLANCFAKSIWMFNLFFIIFFKTIILHLTYLNWCFFSAPHSQVHLHFWEFCGELQQLASASAYFYHVVLKVIPSTVPMMCLLSREMLTKPVFTVFFMFCKWITTLLPLQIVFWQVHHVVMLADTLNLIFCHWYSATD